MAFQEYLSQKYQGHESFLENIIFPIFGEDNYETAWDVELLDSEELQNQAARTGIRSIIRCGTINLDLTPIEVFDITVSDRLMMDKNRVGVQGVIRRVMDTYSGAFMLIHYDNDVKWDWRFTFCQLKDKQEFTDAKRYTFLLGPNQSCRTAAQNFQKLADLNEDITIKDIVSAFDVEALSKAFFDGYKRHYERFVEYITGKRFVKEGGKFVEKTSHAPHIAYYPIFGNDDKTVRDYTKLLLARIVFLHFLQKKGWLGVPDGGRWGDGDEQFMLHLYEKASEKQKEDFLGSVLEPLFFDALNGDRSVKKDLFDTKVLGVVRVPYLNGGLFSQEQLDRANVKYPKELFGDFLEFLYQYNFTIDENGPNEAQVGIDPEMLGKIFENLLEDNKDKGAFYTPKEIVQYMCQESLVAYLVTKTSLDEELLRSFVKVPDMYVDKFDEDQKYSILDAVLSVKICDPAIGSGAFPIGLLNELVRCKEAIYGDEKGRADIKKEIIRDNIYGVDIEKGAVDIARLRFWLSLIVDEEEPLPLPNLDYKIMQGNSLLEWYDGTDLSRLSDTGAYDDMFGGGRAGELKEELSKLLKKYFDASDHQKKAALKMSITETISEILSIAGIEIPEDIDIAENNQFFLWHTWYNDVFTNGGGFDICIGNPPYIRLQNDTGMTRIGKNGKEESIKFADIYSNVKFDTFSRSADIYCLFYEQGFKLLNNKGYLCFITSNKWLKSGYGELLRKYLSDNIQTKLIVDFAGHKVFENATVDTSVLLGYNCKHDFTTLCYKTSWDDGLIEDLSYQVKEKGVHISLPSNNMWLILNHKERHIKELIESHGRPLSEWGVTINYGIKSGCSKAFVVSSEEKAAILNECASAEERHKTEKLFVPILRGKDVDRYSYNWANKWLINTHNGVRGKFPRINIEDYPSLKCHLDQYAEELNKRADKGDTPYNLRNCAYLEDFNKKKVVWTPVNSEYRFTIVPEGVYMNNSLFMITGDCIETICAFANSNILKYYLSLFSGDSYQYGSADFFESLPIPQLDNETAFQIKVLVNKLCSSEVCGISKEQIEMQIENLLLKVYNFSDDEITAIERK